MHLSLQQVLMRLTLVPIAVAGLVALFRFRRLPLNLRYLAGLMWLVLPLNLLGLVLMLQQRNNLFVMPIYTVGELWFLVLVYRHTLHSAAFTRWAPWLVGGFGAYVLWDLLQTRSLAVFHPGQQLVQAALLLLLTGLYFRKLLREVHVQRLWDEPMFWVSAGLFVYCLGYLQIALFSNYLLRYSQELNMNVWAVHSLLAMLLYACYSRALWMSPPR
jgi:hypothetical protein